MPSIKDLKKRIATVKNTQQTTRAMKMVSAAKLRRSQEAILNHRPFAGKMLDLIDELSVLSKFDEEHPLLRQERLQFTDQTTGTKKVTLLVLVTSDRGLCGGFNSNAIKSCQRLIQSLSDSRQVELACVGRKGHDYFKTKKVKIAGYYPEMGGKVSFDNAKKLADILVDRFIKGEVDEVKFIFNEFKNAVTQKVVAEDFLPLKLTLAVSFAEGESTKAATENERINKLAPQGEMPNYIVKPSPEFVFDKLLSKNFAIQVFRILLESQAGEHGARMSAMENATKNAGEMIRKLTLLYNKQRQAGITKELLEIISGSESQKAS